MNKMFTKVAPLLATTACVIWCCWVQIREATPLLAGTEASLPRIERKLLNPDISAVSQRDPFQQFKAELPPSEPVEPVVVVPEKPRFDPRTALDAIRLDATVLGGSRFAVINGKVHEEGADVELENLSDVQCRLLRVLANEIVVQIEQETFHINGLRRPKAPAAAAPPTTTESEVPQELGAGLPEGTPLPDELDRAVADSFARQASLTNDDQPLVTPETDEVAGAGHEDEECDYDQDQLLTEKLNELLNNDE